MAPRTIDPGSSFGARHPLMKQYLEVGGLALLVMCLVALEPTRAWAASAYTTQAFDNTRSNWNPTETQLTVLSVRSGFGPSFKLPLDAQVYAQPLYLPNLNMGTLGTHNVVFVATEANTVYAFDADGGKQLWKVSLTPSGETLQTASDYNNTQVPHIGITSTPVIDTQVLWENVYIDGNHLASSPPYNFSRNSTTVADGPHTISIRAYDKSGTQIASDSVTVTVNNTVAKILSPTNGATVSGTVSVETQVSSQVLWENVYIDGKHLASSPPYTFSWNTTTVSNGQHVISIRAYDKSGAMIGGASVTVTVKN